MLLLNEPMVHKLHLITMLTKIVGGFTKEKTTLMDQVLLALHKNLIKKKCKITKQDGN